MEIVILLVPMAFVVVVVAVVAFVWALRKGQFDDLDSPPWRIVFDDQVSRQPAAKLRESTAEDDSVPEGGSDSEQENRPANDAH